MQILDPAFGESSSLNLNFGLSADLFDFLLTIVTNTTRSLHNLFCAILFILRNFIIFLEPKHAINSSACYFVTVSEKRQGNSDNKAVDTPGDDEHGNLVGRQMHRLQRKLKFYYWLTRITSLYLFYYFLTLIVYIPGSSVVVDKSAQSNK